MELKNQVTNKKDDVEMQQTQEYGFLSNKLESGVLTQFLESHKDDPLVKDVTMHVRVSLQVNH